MVERQQNLGNQNQVANQNANNIQVIENWRGNEDINLIDNDRKCFLVIRDGPPQQHAAIIYKRYVERDETLAGFRALDLETQFYTEIIPHPGLLVRYQSMINGRTNHPSKPFAQFIALEYCQNGKLTKFAQKNQFQLPLAPKYVRYIMRQLIHIFQHLHNNSYCHLQLTTDHICLDQNFNVKVIDFQYCQRAQDNNFVFEQPLGVIRGLEDYQPPEFEFNEDPFDGIKADIYFLGVVLKNLISGCDPEYQYDGDDYHESLLRSLLNKEPTQRPTLQQILNHKFMTEAVDATNEDFVFELQQRRDRLLLQNQRVVDLGGGEVGLVRGGEQDNNVVNLPQRDPVRTHFLVKSDKTHDNLVDIICDISGRVYYQDFETEPPGEYYFTAKHEEKGLEIRVEILASQVQDRVIVEVRRIYGSNLAFLNFYNQFIEELPKLGD